MRNLILTFLRDERGQAVTEYVLMLSFTVAFATFIMKNFIRPAYDKLSKTLGAAIQTRLFGANLHYFRVTR